MMPPIPSFSPTWMLLLIVVVFLIAAISAARRHQRRLGRWDVRVCNRCGTSQPPHAAYCRQCGIRL